VPFADYLEGDLGLQGHVLVIDETDDLFEEGFEDRLSSG